MSNIRIENCDFQMKKSSFGDQLIETEIES